MVQKYYLILCIAFPLFLFGQRGPGGVGNSVNNIIWLDANKGITLSGTEVTNWLDQSGNSFNAIPPASNARPIINSNAVNGYPSLDFDGLNDELRVADNAKLDLTQWHFFIVPKVDLAKDHNAWIVKGDDAFENYEMLSFSDNNIHTPTLYTDGTRTYNSTSANILSNAAFNIVEYSYSNTIGRNIYKNHVRVFNDADNKTPAANNFDLYIGNEKASTGRFINANLAEILMYNAPLNAAQRIIVNNYLSAKYNVSLSASDIYNQDNGANGNFDHEVAGIGRLNASNFHNDAQGSGIVRILNPTNLGDNEFLFWGHDNGALAFNQYTDIPSGMHARLTRVWRVSEVDTFLNSVNVGNIDIQVDLTGLGFFNVSDLRLLIDSDNDGSFADETPVSGAVSMGGGIYAFNGVSTITNNSRFTITRTFSPSVFVRANAGVTNLGTNVSQWSDASGKSNHFTQVTAGSQPISDTNNLVNFNPVVQFSGTRFLNANMNGYANGNSERAFYAVSRPSSTVVRNPIVAQGNTTNYVEIYLANTTTSIGISSSRISTANFSNSIASAPKLGMWSMPMNGKLLNWKFAINGLPLSNVSADTTSINNVNTNNYLGRSNAGGLYSNSICELIHYPFDLTAEENSRIQSYLAIKWGISLSQQATNTNYVNSSNDIIWDASSANIKGFRHKISGIGRDDVFGLYQKQSQSQEDVDVNSVVTMGLGSIAVSNLRNTNTLANGSFLIWADDSADLVEQTTEIPSVINISSACSQGKRISREWMVQRTGNVSGVQIRMNINALGINGRPMSKFRLIIHNSNNFISATNLVTPTSFTNGVLTFDNVTFSDTDSYFTLLTDNTVNASPGGVSVGLTSWFKLDNLSNGSLAPSTGTLVDAVGAYSLTRNSSGSANIIDADAVNFNYNKYLSLSGNAALSRNSLNENDVFTTTRGSAYSVGLVPGAAFVNNIAAGNQQNGVANTASFNNVNSSFATSNTARANIFGVIASPTNVISYTNGLAGTPSAAPGTRVSGVYNLNIGTNASATPGFYNSSISEAFTYSRTLTSNERNRIESYLAIKYGVTLNQTIVQNYVASNGTTIVWNATNNSRYNYNIAAIMRDDCSQLNQKQSRSINATNAYHNMLMVSIGNLASSNSNNNGVFDANLDFMAWGDDSLIGTKTTEFPASLTNGGCLSVKRLSKEWKVQTNGFFKPVQMRFYLSGIVPNTSNLNNMRLLIDVDSNFSNGGTRIVNPSTYDSINQVLDFTGVELNNQEFFTLVIDIYASAPANTSSNLKMWLRADKGISISSGVSRWEDQSVNSFVATQNTPANQPIHKNNSVDNINFNPIVDFSAASTHRMAFTNTVLNSGSGDFSVYIVSKRALAAQQALIGFGTSVTNQGFDIGYNASTQAMFNNTSSTYYPNTGITPFNLPHVIKYSFSGSNKRRVSVNGRLVGIDSSTTFNLVQNVANIGVSRSGNNPFDGELAELIVFQTNLSGVNESKIQSYLAVKYGLSIDQTTPTNYLSSYSAVIWDATQNAQYKNRIFGIANDRCSGLSQKQSRSILDTNGFLTVSLNSMAETNLANTANFVSDSIYLMFGDNNLSMSEISAEIPSVVSSCSKRLAREWKADISGKPTAVELRFNFGLLNVSGTVSNDFKLIVDTDGDGNFLTGPVTVIAASEYVGKVLKFNNVLLNDGAVFTIVTKDVANGLASITSPGTEVSTATTCSKNGWVYIYDPADSTKRLFAVYTNGNSFSPSNVKINTGSGYTMDQLSKANRFTNKAVSLMNRFVQVSDATGGNDTINGGMIIRFYYDPAEKANTISRMTQLRTDSSITGNLSWNWFKAEKTIPEIISTLTANGIQGPSKVWITNPDSAGTEDGVTFAEFRNITEFSTFGGGMISGNLWNILPIKLLEFKGVKNENQSDLSWVSASEKNASHYSVERSANGKDWNEIGTVTAKGNSSVVTKYQFKDVQPIKAVNYYRLKMIDVDGYTEYSKTIAIDHSGVSSLDLHVFPNPVAEQFTVNTKGMNGEKVALYIFNVMGEVVFSNEFTAEGNEFDKVFERTAQMTPGTYTLVVKSMTTGNQNSIKLIMQ